MRALMAMFPVRSAIRHERFENELLGCDADMARLRKSGEIAAKTGEYEERGPRGGKLADDKTVTIDDRTDRLPPTQKKGRTYVRTGPPKE